MLNRSSEGPIPVLIVDDEPPARKGLRAFIEEHAEVRVVGEAGSGREAVAAIRELRPALVFLDVQMPEGTGFDVIAEIGVDQMPVVIFSTAYDAYALRAFEAHALDFLLKPFDRERFETVLERACTRIRHSYRAEVEASILSLLQMHERPRYLQRLNIRLGSRIRLVEVQEVHRFEAERNYVRAHLTSTSYLVRDTLAALETKLDPARFVRVHRSLIISIDRVLEIEPLFAGEYILTMRDGTRITTGRTFRSRIQEVFGLRI